MNDKITDLPIYKGIQQDIQAFIKENLNNARSAGMFANRVRNYFTQHKSDYNELLKRYNNDYLNMCADLVSALNDELKEVPMKNTEVVKLESQYNGVKHDLEQLRANNPDIDPTDKTLCALYTKLTKLQDNISKLPNTTMEDVRYKSTGLTGLLNEVQEYLSDIVPDAQPSDAKARAKVKFDKKMGLDDALYTLLWNTRGNTIPLSVMNLKAWAARFVERISRPEQATTNRPTMLVMRSRTDMGNQKGSTGKTRICHSCLHMLAEKGLNVTPPNTSVSIPTNDRVDKEMSDKTMVFMDDIMYKDVSWETLNKFCDGTYIKNRGKYQKEGYILPYGNILGTSNYDMNYDNKVRYPVIEFSCDNARIAQNDPVVKSHAKYKYDAKNDTYDYCDAWETLFSYATDNSVQWLSEYDEHRIELAQNVSSQRTNLELLVLAFLSRLLQPSASSIVGVFSPNEVVSWIKREHPSEVRFVNLATVCGVLNKIGVTRSNTTNNPYLAMYKIPSSALVYGKQMEVTQQQKWDWIAANALLPYDKQTSQI